MKYVKAAVIKRGCHENSWDSCQYSEGVMKIGKSAVTTVMLK